MVAAQHTNSPYSLCLQERYGDGYMLTVTTAVDRPVDTTGIERLVAGRVAGAAVARSCGGELVFRLPVAAASAFPDLLDAVDAEGA